MKTIRLYGWLGRQYGREWVLDVASTREAVRAISVQCQGFAKALIDHAPGFRVYAGRERLKEGQLGHPVSQREVIRIVPLVAGAKDDFSGIIFGAALIGLSFLLPAAPLFSISIGTATFAPSLASLAFGFGVNMVLGGIIGALTSTPKPTAPGVTERPENMPSYVFNGAVNTSSQGNPVPLLYGRVEVGSQVLSAGIYTEELIPITTAAVPEVTAPEDNTTQQVYDNYYVSAP